MYKKSLILALLFFAVSVSAADPQARLLIHPTWHPAESGNWGVAGWIVGNGKQDPNLVSMGGLRYQRERFWTEFMVGGIRAGSRTRPFFDTRTNVNLTKRVNVWGETAAFSDQFYWFFEADYSRKKWLVGVETENVHLKGLDSLGLGSHIKFRVAKGVWIGPAYQFRRNEPNVVRLYVVIHLPF